MDQRVLLKATRILPACLAGLLGLGPALSPGMAALKEPPIQVSVEDLEAQSFYFDGKRVVVTGRISRIEAQMGRRGGRFLIIVLEAERAEPSGQGPSVNVFAEKVPPVSSGDRALVQGTYHRNAMRAGRSLDHFIDAEAILRQQDE